MDPIFIYIHLDEYLAQWFINDQGGKYPVELKRGSVESNILESFLAKQPEDIPLQTEANNPDAVKIAIPFFKSKDVYYFNYLPKRAEELLVATIRNRFDVELWTTLHKFTSIINRQDELIYAFTLLWKVTASKLTKKTGALSLNDISENALYIE